MNKFKVILLLTIISLSDSTLFPSNTKPIYTVKDNEIHRSSGKIQSECTKYEAVGSTADNRTIYYQSKCNEHNKK